MFKINTFGLNCSSINFPRLPMIYEDFSNYTSGSLGGQGLWFNSTGAFYADGLGNIFPNYETDPARSLAVYRQSLHPNQYAEVIFGSVGVLGQSGAVGPAVRSLSDSLTCYTASWDREGQVLYLIAFNSGVYTLLRQTGRSYADGDILRIEASGAGAGIRLSIKEYTGVWNTVFSNVTVATNRRIESGYIGVRSQYAAQSLKITTIQGGNL